MMDDLIRRKDIIDSLAEYMDAFYNENGKMMYSDHILNEADCEDLKKWIMSFPSIQPEQKTGITIPDNATNGSALCYLYPDLKYSIQNGRVTTTVGVAASFDLEWWNTPYKR